ncbi:MAG: YfbU family protein [Clostridium sporogenes]|nr:YfbU family protein [Clostridium sporogenes]
MELSKKERLMLWNQYEILKALYPDDIENYEIYQKIVLDGYKYNYENLATWILDETPEEVSKFVFDVFNMFRILNNSFSALKDKEKLEIDKTKLCFSGYDGNEETDYYSYTNFVIDDLKRYEELSEDKNFQLNSHCQMVNTYKKMLNKWVEIRAGKYDNLTLEQIKKIIDEY